MAWYTPESSKREQKKKNELWKKCKKCLSHHFLTEWQSNLNVCPACNYHDSINAWERISLLFDADSFEELFSNISPVDSLGFNDLKGSYVDKIEANKKKTGISEAVICGHGMIGGIHTAASVMDFRFLGGSLGSATGEKILLMASFALKKKIPYVIISSSGGARMQEGVLSLMQMAKTCAGIARLNRKDIPYISVMTNPTTGGVTASYAMMGDINLAEPGSVIGFAGRRVIEQTIGEKLPDDFQTAEYLLEHGFIDRIVHRKDMKQMIFDILKYYQK